MISSKSNYNPTIGAKRASLAHEKRLLFWYFNSIDNHSATI